MFIKNLRQSCIVRKYAVFCWNHFFARKVAFVWEIQLCLPLKIFFFSLSQHFHPNSFVFCGMFSSNSSKPVFVKFCFMKCVFSSDLTILAFLNVFVTKRLLLHLQIFFLRGAWIFRKFLLNRLNSYSFSQSSISLTEQKVESNWRESSELK